MTPRNIVLGFVTTLVLVGAGYAAGRYATPDKIVVTEKIVTVQTEKAVSTMETDKILNALQTLNRNNDVKVIRITEKAPDGTTRITETSEDKSKIASKTESQSKERQVETKIVEKLVYQDREVTKTVERSRPQWALALQPGFDVAGALGRGDGYSLLPSSGSVLRHVVIGASLERRILGPVSGGIWANTAGMGGVTLKVEF